MSVYLVQAFWSKHCISLKQNKTPETRYSWILLLTIALQNEIRKNLTARKQKITFVMSTVKHKIITPILYYEKYISYINVENKQVNKCIILTSIYIYSISDCVDVLYQRECILTIIYLSSYNRIYTNKLPP